MSDGITPALIALGGVFLSAFVSYLVSVKTTRYNYKQLFAETVSQSRNKWLNEMRGLISTILVVAKEECVLSKEPVASDEYLKARDEILLRLNMKESLHILLEYEIEKLDHANSNNVDDISGKILTISRTILKEEWEKVKSEAKGGK